MFKQPVQLNSYYYYELANHIYSEKCGNISSNTTSNISAYCDYLTYLDKGCKCLPCLENFNEDKKHKELCIVSYYDGLISILQQISPNELPAKLKVLLRNKKQIQADLAKVATYTCYSILREKSLALINFLNKLRFLQQYKDSSLKWLLSDSNFLGTFPKAIGR